MDSLRRKNKPSRLRIYAPVKQEVTFATSSIPSNPKPVLLERSRETHRSKDRKNRSFRRVAVRILFGLIGFSLVFSLFGFVFFSWKIGEVTRLVQSDSAQKTTLSETLEGATSLLSPLFDSSRTLLPGEETGRTNILLLGKANEKTAGQKLTDTIMIASLDFSKKKIALLSLPRDLYAEVPEQGFSTKINALYQYDLADQTGAEITKETISHITGLPIHGFIAIDYDGFIRTVDILGGVSLYVEQDLFDTRFPGPNYSYETFEIKKGWQDLDGETALKYARERHSDPEGDFGRAKRQQAILSSMKDKALSMKTFLNPVTISELIDVLGAHIRTDLSPENFRSLVALSREFDTRNISTAVVDAWKKNSLLKVSHIQVGAVRMFILVPRTGDWSEIRELSEYIFDLDRLAARREAIADENARIHIRNESDSPILGQKIRALLSENLGIRQIEITSTPHTKNASTPRDRSLLVRRTSTEVVHTADEIIRKLNLEALSLESLEIEEPDSTVDIIIFLGNDLANRLSFEEDTLEDFQSAESDPDYQKRLDTALIEKGTK